MTATGRMSRQVPQKPQQSPRRRLVLTLLRWLALIAAVAAVIWIVRGLRTMGSASEVRVSKLPCGATQDVTPFGDNILYYDGTSIHCLTAGGGIRWSVPVGLGAHFSCSTSQVVAWTDNQVYIFDRSGHTTYNETFREPIQFARIGSRYCAMAVGEDTEPQLLVKNLDGTQVDQESDAYSGMLLLDIGFYGEADQYLWTMAMDVYSTAINTVLNTYQVGKMTTGVQDLGSFLAYKVLYENGRLRVFTTQYMYTYDYKAVQDISSTQLVHGWRLIDYTVPDRGNGSMLLAPTSQIGVSSMSIQELRLLSGSGERRYTIPSACVGAGIIGRNIYGISRQYCYRADVDSGRFTAFSLSLPQGSTITELLGFTTSHAIVAAGDDVYTVSLPR
ncbi:MAG: hypothetical protein IKP40_09560 [Clostridia bacterium]|nr:hypothetical protein [Clostridia bacterium]